MHTSRLAAAAVLALAAFGAQAQAPAPAAVPAAPKMYTVRASDVQSIDSIVAALYDVISGPVGKARDFDRLHSLFTPDARMAAIGHRPDGSYALRTMTVDDYVARNAKVLVEVGFFESEKARTTEQFGQLAHVFSTYEARKASPEAAPFMRGINSIQLVNDGSRWWIASLIWRAEDDKLKLPERYLQSR
ncbi:MAG TPA: hypothetical protein VFF16_11215 [Telluria sp.]|nr:hypothetical protein [Telluria sp.]